MSDADLTKKREIQFAKFPPGQIPEAADQLRRLGGIEVEPKYENRSLGIAYDLTQHTLQDIDGYLENLGYHLDNGLMNRLMRALVYYLEETQLHNLGAPVRRLRRSSQEAYGQAWAHHPHGDHDDTPPEWREYK